MKPESIDLLRLISQGNHHAFRALYDDYSVMVYNTAIAYSKNTHDAEEITQEVFIKIFNNAKSFKGNSKLSTWIYRITVNTALDQLSKNKNRHLYESQSKIHDFYLSDIDDQKSDETEYTILLEAVEYLKANQKTAFILSYIEGLARQEVAEVMEISLKATESLLQRAKQKLRDILQEKYPNRRKSKN